MIIGKLKLLLASGFIIIPGYYFFLRHGVDYDADSRGWELSADKRIEQYRKGDIIIKINQPGTYSIKIEQLTHAFSFGSAVQASMILDSTENGEKYRGIIKKYFNEVVFENDLKWPSWRDDKYGKFDKTKTLKALDWLNRNGIKVRGHYLVWCPLQPYEKFYSIISEDIYKNPVLFKQALIKHIDEILKATNSKISEWDLLNHPVTRTQRFQVANENGKMLITDYVGKEFYEEIFRRVKEDNMDLQLNVNEGDILTRKADKKEAYYNLIKDLRSKGVSLGGIGFMGHCRSDDLPEIENVQKTLTEFSKFKLPMKITEFDVLFGQMNEHYELSEEESKLQSDFTRDFMKICFSNPAVDGFIMWGFWEKAHWYPSSALWDKDWNLKPNGKAILDLMFKSYWSEFDLKNINNHKVKFRGFLGKYSIIIRDEKGSEVYSSKFELTRKGVRLNIELSKCQTNN
jgi:endo-1,4-beta-xylanase